MQAILKHPAVHFLAAGAAMFVAAGWIPRFLPGALNDHRIVISAAQVTELRTRHAVRHSELPDERETAALVDAAAVDEMLYREAIERGLDDDDAVVERRLVQDMRFFDQTASDDSLLLRQAHALGLRDGDPVIHRRLIQRMRSLLAQQEHGAMPTLAELHAYFEAHRDLFEEPPRVGLSQIFFAGTDAKQRALATLDDLEALGAGAEAAGGRGDPFIAGAELPLQSQRGLAKVFGPELAHASLSLPVAQWSGPLGSPYGVHLLWIRERRWGSIPAFETVRDAVRQRVEAERAAQAVSSGIAELRRRYRVEVESPRS